MSDQNFPRRGFIGGVAAFPLAAIEAAAADTPQAKMKLAVGADHAGFPLKGPMIQLLRSWGHTVTDCGTHSTEPVDFPDIARKVCDEILAGRSQRAILVCGTGVGAAIAANKIPKIRAALCHDTFCAHQSVEHDNVNVLCLGAWVIGPKLAEEVLTAYLNAKFASADPDFQRRLRKVEEMEKRR
jgi:ribose 5-phosphate isomerase B